MYQILHEELETRAIKLASQLRQRHGEHIFIFPVPRGGFFIAYLLLKYLPYAKITDVLSPEVVIIDDIIDSGKTREHYLSQGYTNFYALYDKDKEAISNWLVFPWEVSPTQSIEHNIVRMLQYIGEDPNREGLVETPDRVVRSWTELFSGYKKNPEDVFKCFDIKHNELILMKNIELYSTCEHHMLPFVGHAHIAYIADGKVIGASKLARLLDIYARRLQIQENIGSQVVDALMSHLKPKGAACIIEAQHLCMCSRGVSKQHSVMVTSAMRGIFLEDSNARAELLKLIK